MTASTRWDKTLPTLLDRLVDSGPANGASLFVSPQRYLESVKRDLLWLLKTEVQRSSESAAEERRQPGAGVRATGGKGRSLGTRFRAEYPNANESVLAYGVPALKGDLGMRALGPELVANVERAIRVFEPRLDPQTLRVRLLPHDDSEGEDDGATVSSLAFEIEGDVRMKPLPEHLLLKALFTPALAQWHIEGVSYGS
jgi:type VI secretion system protein ImpF